MLSQRQLSSYNWNPVITGNNWNPVITGSTKRHPVINWIPVITGIHLITGPAASAVANLCVPCLAYRSVAQVSSYTAQSIYGYNWEITDPPPAAPVIQLTQLTGKITDAPLTLSVIQL